MRNGQPLTFYSPDHPAPLTPDEAWSSGLTSLEEAKRLGFIGICETTDWKLRKMRGVDEGPCGQMPSALMITTRRFF